MKVSHIHKTDPAIKLLERNEIYRDAFQEVVNSISAISWPGEANSFTINNTRKNINGVVPLKERCYIELEETYNWYREYPLHVLKYERKKGGPIDVYKIFESGERIGAEFETGNIGSGHRAMNKLFLGLKKNELDLAMIFMPVKKLAYYLTDRITNYEELEPYFDNYEEQPFIFIGFDASYYSADVPSIPKGKDGMSSRSVKKWKEDTQN